MAFQFTTKRTTIAFLLVSVALISHHPAVHVHAQPNGQLVKMELMHQRSVGHARSDPIISQTCAAGHVHTFYGPMELHPNTSSEDLLAADPSLSSSEVVENQSLYWHPTLYEYEVNTNTNIFSSRVYKRVVTKATTYYRWDNSVQPLTKEFPPGFRYIASSADPGAPFYNMYSECCNYQGGVQDCQIELGLKLPNRPCVHLDIVLGGPTCWDGVELGDTNDHISHMAYTVDGTIQGACPTGFDIRLPQVQLFTKVENYKGETPNRKYQMSNYDGSGEFHWDFLNGWEEGKLQEIMDNCEPAPNLEPGEVNPPVTCTPATGDNRFLTENIAVEGTMCDWDVRDLILDERIDDIIEQLPMGSCTGNLISKSWDSMSLQVLPSGSVCDGSEEKEDDDNIPPVTPAPSPYESLVPTTISCLDSPLKFPVGKKKRKCLWVANKQKCSRAGVPSHCPATCGTPQHCTKDSTLKFDVNKRLKKKNCAKWVAKKKWKRCRLKGIRETCRESCANFP